MDGELRRPLGLDIENRTRVGRRPARATLAFGLCGALLLGASAAVIVERHAVVRPNLAMNLEAAQEPSTPDPVVVGAVDLSPPAEPTAVAAQELPPIPPGGVSFYVEDPSSVRQPTSLAYLPSADLLQDTGFGAIPVRGADGRRPFDVYAGEPVHPGGAKVALVVGGIGISQSGSRSAISDLPRTVTLAFSPTGNSRDRWMREARQRGHELLLQVPMEPTDYPANDPGPNTLTVADATAGDLSAFHENLASLTNYIGVMNYMGGQFVSSAPALDALFADLRERGLMYFDDGTTLGAIVEEGATASGVPRARADVVIDRSLNEADIARQLDVLERIARAEGNAIGVLSAFEMSITTVARWISEAERRGVAVVPLSELAYDPERLG